jgi:isocitrate dehydrogenase kinase/phosphatase
MTQTLSATPNATANQGGVELVKVSTQVVNAPAKVCAHRIADGFVQYDNNFRALTGNSPLRFEQCDWQNSQQDVTDRERLYDVFVERTLAGFEDAAGGRALEPMFWQDVRQDFAQIVEGLHDGGLRRAFFNSVFKRCFDAETVMPRCGFVPINYAELVNKEVPDTRRQVRCAGASVAAANELLQSLQIEADWLDVHASAIQLGKLLETQWQRFMPGSLQTIEVLDAVLYRFTRAFVVGQLIGDDGAIPFALAFTNPEGGVVIDNLMLGEADLTELFGRTHANFQVELDQVTDAVLYLKRLTPRLQHLELFSALGHRAE